MPLCTCPGLCKGGREVTQKTFRRHEKQRATQIGDDFREYLAGRRASQRVARDLSEPVGSGLQATQELGSRSDDDMQLSDAERQANHDDDLRSPTPESRHSPIHAPASVPTSSPTAPALPSPALLTSPAAPRPTPMCTDLPETSRIPEIQLSLEFIKLLRDAHHADSGLSPDQIHQLENPGPVSMNTFDQSLRFSLGLFFSCRKASEETYSDCRTTIESNVPGIELHSYASIKSQLQTLSGVYPVVNDMCVKTCAAFTGPFKERDTCPICGEPRYTAAGAPRQTFTTIPVGPQIQAQWSSPQSAKDMRYREERTRIILDEIAGNGGNIPVYEDFMYGTEYLEAVANGEIKDGDTVLLFSIDGAQLYRMKKSDCWLYIWVILNLAPDKRYKVQYVLPGGCIPGPNNPKNTDSFLFPGLYHLVAVKNAGGLMVWDGARNAAFRSSLHLVFVTADALAMAHIVNWVGHHGKLGCRIFCGLSGRHKPGAPHYYPALLLPTNYNAAGCSHGDIDVYSIPSGSSEKYLEHLRYVIASSNQTQYQARRKETGIVKPNIFLACPLLYKFPLCLVGDTMHIDGLNIPDIIINLWRGMIDCDKTDSRTTWDWAVLKGDIWQVHGRTVAEATMFLPGCFERPPRNPAEKISSGYKASEFLVYLYGLCPALLYQILPDKYWRNFCKLVRGIRLLSQRSISSADLVEAHMHLLDFSVEFEILYCQRRTDRLHFTRQCLHFLIHRAPETVRVGPLANLAQWVLERTIGNLGEEIRQHQNPYANLAQRCVLRAQTNALKTMVPELAKDTCKLPRGAWDLGNRHVLLRKSEDTPYPYRDCEEAAIRLYLSKQNALNMASLPLAYRWARLLLPNGQIARSYWSEGDRKTVPRRARNVKLAIEGTIRFGEVLFYFSTTINNKKTPLAMVSLYSFPDAEIRAASCDTVWACNFVGDDAVTVVPANAIMSVVGMVPFQWQASKAHWETKLEKYFVVEKLGLSVAALDGEFEGGMNNDE